MIATLIFALAASQQELPSAKSLIGAMFLKYYNASTVKGRIRLTVTASTGSASLDTEVQVERPGRLYIHQVKNVGDKKQWLVTADGTTFTYDPPRGTAFTSDSRLFEEMGPTKPVKDLKDAYSASALSLGDRSVPLDIAVARSSNLDDFRYQLATIKTEMETTLDGKPVYVIDGNWREYGQGPVLGKFQIYVSKEGDLYRYVVSQVVKIPGANMAPQQLVQTWDVDLVCNGPVDQRLFTVVK